VNLTAVTIEVGPQGRVSGLLALIPRPKALFVLAHGAGAGMQHRFLAATASGLAERGVATLRYQFPYMEQRRSRPDTPEVAAAAVRAAVARAAQLAPGVPLIAGGKSFGGRMTSTAQAAEPLPGVAGLAFLGFPLHPPGKPDTARAAHLDAVGVPMLFLQGTRDEFAQLDLLQSVCARLGARARLHLFEGGDHSFHVLKKTGRTDADVFTEMLDVVAQWAVLVTNNAELGSRNAEQR
jgi:predicted alpha/beta-hydrolase family hydrolase